MQRTYLQSGFGSSKVVLTVIAPKVEAKFDGLRGLVRVCIREKSFG